MKKDRKTTPLIAAHSASKNNHKQTSAKRKSLTLDRITEGIVALDDEMKYAYVNKCAGKLLGRKPKELVGEKLVDLKSEQPPFVAACHQAFETQTIVRFQGYFAPTAAWLEGRAYPSEDGVSVLFTEATDFKGTGNALAKSEEKFSKAFRLSPSAMAIIDSQDSRIVDVNQSLLNLFKLERGEIVGHTMRELGITTNPDDSSALARLVQDQDSVHDYELVIHTRDGQRHYLLVSIEKIEFEGAAHNLISAVDITERKLAEEKLLDISKFPAENPNPVMRFTRDGELLYANEAAAPLLAFWHAEHGQTIPAELAELFASFTDSATGMEIELEGDGKIFTCLVVPIHDTGYVNLYFRDITQRKQAEESLRGLVNQTTAGITRMDMDGQITFVNQTFCEMLGYPESELIGKTIWEISSPDDLSKNRRLFERMRVEGQPYQLEKRLIRKNGSVLWVTAGTSPLRDANGSIYSAVSILTDITRRKHAEQSLLETARRTLYLSSLSDTIRHLSRPFQIEIEATHALGVHLKATRVAYAEAGALETLFIRHDYVNGVENNIGEFQVSDFVPAELLSKFRQGNTVIVTDVAKNARLSETQSLALDTAIVPLVKDERLIAALIVQQSEPHDWSNEEISLAEETAERMQAAMDRALTEEKLLESEKRFRILSNTVPSMVWATAPDGTVLYLNDHWYQYTGLSPDESISNWAELSLHPDDAEAYVASWQQALTTVPDEYVQEVRYRRYDGEYRWFQSRAVPARDESGAVTAWYGVSTDIHDRVEKQDELQKVINQTSFMLTRCSSDLRYRFVSRAYADMLGRTPEDVAGRPIVEIMGAEGFEVVTPYIDRVLQGDRVEYEEKIPFAGVGAPWLHIVYTPDRDAQGNVIGWFGSITDITDRKEAEQKLRARAEEIQAVLDVSPVGIFVSNDPECTHITANPAGYELVQMPAQPGANISKSAPSTERPSYRVFREGVELPAEQLPMQMAARLGMEVEAEILELRFDNGARKSLYTYARPLFDEMGKTRGAVAAMLDITERKQMEDALHFENERFMRFIDSNIIGIVIGDANGRIVLANDYYLNLIGVTRQDFTDDKVDWKKITPAEWLPADEKAIAELQEHGSCEPYEKEYVRADGTRVPVYIANALLPGPRQEIAAFVLDMTARKQAEEKLRASEEKYRRIVETANEGIWEIDRDMRTVFVNARVAEMLGYTVDEMMGRSAFDFVFPEDHPDGEQRVARAKRGVAARSDEFRYRRKDGTPLWTIASTTPKLDDQGNFIGSVAMIMDIAERKRAEQSLIEYARRQTALYTLTDRLHRANSMEEVFNAAMDAILNALQCSRVSILLFDESKVMHFVAWRGLSDEYRNATDGHSPWKYGEENPVPIFYNDIATADLGDSLRTVIRNEGIGSLGFIPLVFQGELIGKFMVYFNAPHEFSENELDLSQTIARQLASGVQRKRDEEALRRSEERFSRFMQYLPGLAWIKDSQGRYIYANTAAEKAFRTPEAQLYGRTDDEIFPAEIASQFKRNDEQALGEGGGVQVVETLQQEDGILHHSLVTKFPIPGPDGEPAMIGGTAFDITERKVMEDELLASRQRLAATYEYSPIGLVEYSPDGKFLKVNEEMCRILGYERDELLQLSMKDVTYEEDYVAEEVLYRRLVNGEIPSYKIEKRFKRKDGSLVWTQKIRSCVHNSSGKLLYTIGAIVDISERKRAESRLVLLAEVSELTRTLEEPDELMSAVADRLGAHLQVKRCLFNEIDLDNNIEIVHRDYHDGVESVQGTHKITDYSRVTTAEMIAGKTVVNHDSKTDPRTAPDYERSYVPNGERAYVAVPLMREDRWVASLWVSTDTPRQWSRNDVALLETIAERTWTATEKLRIHAALRDSEERLRVTFNTTAVGFATLALDTRFVEVNDAFCSIVGYSREELLAMNCYSLIHPDYLDSTSSHIAQLLAGEVSSFVLEQLYGRSDGTQIWVQNSVSLLRDADGNPLHLIALCQDVTERRNAEDQLHQLNVELEGRVQRRTAELQSANEFLRQSEATSRLILESVPDAIVIANPEGVVVHCNTQVESLFGYSPNELLGRPVGILFPERYHQHLIHPQTFGENPTHRMMGLDRQFFALRRNGDEFPVEVSLSPISNNTTWDVIITIRDNTEQRKAQEALRVSEEKLRTLFEILPVGISFLNKNAQIIDMNSALTQILGLSKHQLLRGSFKSRDYIRSDGSLMPPSEFASIRALTEQKTIYNVETGIVKDNGETIWTSVNAAPVKVADVAAVIVTADITERKHAENALHKNRERLRALSRRLVEVQEDERRAIARELHDRVGQNLAALNLNLNILRSQLSEDALAKVGSRLTDSVTLVNDILTITRSVMADLRSNVLDDYGLESALREYADQFTQRFGVQVIADKTTGSIPRFDPSIEMTLLRIAQEALTNVARHSQATQATITLSMEGKAVKMTIQDNGVGILSWQKANQKGSHGLRIIRERTEAFDGSVQIQSAYKKGTTVEVKIPIENGNQVRPSREKRS